jgi:hypothetical protein
VGAAAAGLLLLGAIAQSRELGQKNRDGRRARKKMNKEGKGQELINLRGDRYLTHRA